MAEKKFKQDPPLVSLGILVIFIFIAYWLTKHEGLGGLEALEIVAILSFFGCISIVGILFALAGTDRHQLLLRIRTTMAKDFSGLIAMIRISKK